MRWTILSLISFLWVILSAAQNLVPNPGFEILTKCPKNLNTNPILVAPPWLTPFYATNNGQYGTADIYNVCSPPNRVGVPTNVYGFQNAHQGNSYAGVILWASGGSPPDYSAREYLQVPLKSTLEKGSTYYVGFYLNMANRQCATKKVGIHFSAGPVPPAGETIFNYEPQIETNQSWLSDTLGWMLIEGCYTAAGGEDFMTIGNFRTNLESKHLEPCPDIHLGYYYVDDVFVMNMTKPDLGDDFSLCPGDYFTLFAGGGNTNYLWQDLSSADSFVVAMPGTYFVTASNICGVVSDTIIVSAESNPPHINLPDAISLCEGDQLVLDPQVLGVDFEWSNGSQLPIVSVDTAGEYSLTVTNGCGSDTHTVSVLDIGAEPIVSLGNDIPICPGEILHIQPIHSGVTSWLWQNGSTDSSLIISSPGIINVTVTNACGTASDTAMVVASSAPPQLELGEDRIACEGEEVVISTNILGVSYLWQDGTTQSTLSTQMPGTFILQISNFCGTDADTIGIEFISPPLFPFLGNDTTLCAGDVHTLYWEAAEGVTLQWNTGSSFPYYFIEAPGQYFIAVSNFCGENSDTINLDFISPPEPFSLGKDTVLCPGTSISLSIDQTNGTITWQDGSHQKEIIANQDQTYSATIANQCGEQEDEINIALDKNVPIYEAARSVSICPEDTIILDVAQAFEASYQWNTGENLSRISLNQEGLYDVLVSTPCVSTTFDFNIVPGEDCDYFPPLFIPNVFSPNRDNINDNFVIDNIPYADRFDIEFALFDRWGNTVFHASQLPISWDGKYRGQVLNPGVFAYRMEIKYKNVVSEKGQTITGNLTMVK